MTCTNELHAAQLPYAHAVIHEIAAEATCAGIDKGRDLTLKELDGAVENVKDVMELDPSSLEECTRMLGVLVRRLHPYVAAPIQ